jgi:hypothetical protein
VQQALHRRIEGARVPIVREPDRLGCAESDSISHHTTGKNADRGAQSFCSKIYEILAEKESFFNTRTIAFVSGIKWSA